MTAALAIRALGQDAANRDLRDADVVTYLDLDGDGVPDAVRTRTLTYGPGQSAHVVETIEAVDDEGNVRPLSLVERFESGRRTAIA